RAAAFEAQRAYQRVSADLKVRTCADGGIKVAPSARRAPLGRIAERRRTESLAKVGIHIFDIWDTARAAIAMNGARQRRPEPGSNPANRHRTGVTVQLTAAEIQVALEPAEVRQNAF